jgi:hypothetical protein
MHPSSAIVSLRSVVSSVSTVLFDYRVQPPRFIIPAG